MLDWIRLKEAYGYRAVHARLQAGVGEQGPGAVLCALRAGWRVPQHAFRRAAWACATRAVLGTGQAAGASTGHVRCFDVGAAERSRALARDVPGGVGGIVQDL